MSEPKYEWTRIDPAIHTPEWFNGKGVTFLSTKGGVFVHGVLQALALEPLWLKGFSHFLLHPPLPDPVEEEIEREAKIYGHQSKGPLWGKTYQEDRTAAFIAGARAFLGRKS